ncbi:putative pectinesterase 29 [Hibiscus syriacus]|uniref:Pectinesterase n=1 Tax=Hibiscus syriacus TaxID=106335 RepID=A0A6A3A186_HIBSY|nr:probable pectinesterase 29 [Hibiscus syriacus]KAE8698070.1 putative pectinesterase 29 [Hibiscus syriacus]
MELVHCLCTLCIVFLLCLEQISEACKTVTVDKSGRGHYSTIQSAVNSVPSHNRNWHCINVSPGTYREKVVIPHDKPFIILKGSGQKKTMVVWNEPYLQAPTFSSLADNIIVNSISFVNSYNGPNSKNARAPAVAALINGDKSFFRCGFSSVQDTLWDATGRHYFKRCHIEGAVDFIFGNGQSIYEDCSIRYLGDTLPRGLAGFITAQGRNNPQVSSGFVFKNCRIYGKGTTFLGRPWRDFSRVLFYNCRFSNVVNPRGWNAWNSVGEEKYLTFAEYNNYGPGANKSKRVKWLKNLKAPTVAMLTSMSFIDSDGWLQSFPVKYF